MSLSEPYPTLEELMDAMGEAGIRLAEIGATEAAAGNISVYVGWEVDLTRLFPQSEAYRLPTAAPELAGHGFLVTGSGRRLHEIRRAPLANLAYIQVEAGGRTGRLFTSPERLFARPTSEFNSHLAVHRDQITHHSLNFHVLVHAQPMHLVYLSHIPRYQDTLYLSRHVLRWQPETIMSLPEGISCLPFLPPGSSELMLASIRAMRDHHLILWGKHGVLSRSDRSVKSASDLIEYAEVGARYEYMNLTNHGLADGLSAQEIRQICTAYQIEQHLF